MILIAKYLQRHLTHFHKVIIDSTVSNIEICKKDCALHLRMRLFDLEWERLPVAYFLLGQMYSPLVSNHSLTKKREQVRD